MSDFKSLGINSLILKSLEKKKYVTPTSIQSQAIPHLLLMKDLLGIAQTGTGKTAAFSIPILHNLVENRIRVSRNSLRVLILAPTRELVSQISLSLSIYGQGLDLKYITIFGGVSERQQISNLARGTDIAVATPGRLLDLTNQGHIDYKQLEVLVLDEADRMLDMGFINDIKKIIQKLPKNRQTIFLSATMPKNISALANSILKNPVEIEVTPQSTTVEKISQIVKFVDKSNKLALLKDILKQEEVTSVLVFTKTKHKANSIADSLNSCTTSAAIHGNKSQHTRDKALRAFRLGNIKVLVATDIASRGIDIPNISHVINYDLPNEPESYVHRIGRTARAGENGVAISFCDRDEHFLLQDIEKAIKYQIPVNVNHRYHDNEPRMMKKKGQKPKTRMPEAYSRNHRWNKKKARNSKF